MKNILKPRPMQIKHMLSILSLGVVFVPNAYAADDECYYNSAFREFVSCVDSYNRLDAIIHSDIDLQDPYSVLYIGGPVGRLESVNVELAPNVTITSLNTGLAASGANEVNVTAYGNIISGSASDIDDEDPELPDAGLDIRMTQQASVYITGGSNGLSGIANVTQFADSQFVNRSGSKDTAAIYSNALETHVTTSGEIRSTVGEGIRIQGLGPIYIDDENNGSGGYVIVDSHSIFDVHAKSGSTIEGGSEGAGIRTIGGGVLNVKIDSGATLGALSDVAITADGYKYYDAVYQDDPEDPDDPYIYETYSFVGATTAIENAGTITGVIKLSSGQNTIVNEETGVWNVRQFADTNRDGIRDTVAEEATSEFGGGATSLVNRGKILLSANSDGTPNKALFNNLPTFENYGQLILANNVVGDRFTIDGDYIGNGGTVSLDADLAGDTSRTDMLIINGNSTGNSFVTVNNISDTGAQTVGGIKIIEVGGTSTGSFNLLGNYVHEGEQAVVGGAYAYKLYHGGIVDPADGDWYLRSHLRDDEEEPLYQAGVPTYEAYPQTLLGLNGVATLQERIGNRFWGGSGNRTISQGADAVQSYAPPEEAGSYLEGNGVWGRIEGAHSKIKPRFSSSETDYNQNVLKMQAGVDGLLSDHETGTLIGGVFVQYVHGKAKTKSVHGDGEISTDGYGIGGTMTWHSNEGLYIDGQVQATWYKSDLSSTLTNSGLKSGNDGFGYALSVESGKRWAISPEWSVTPQAQLVYSKIDFDSFRDIYDATVRLDKGDSLQGRLGMTIDHETSWQNAHGMTDRAHVYSIANRGGSVCLNSFERFFKWISAAIMLPPSLVSAR